MRVAALAAVLVLSASLSFAAGPAAKPAPSGGKPAASAKPTAKPKIPERDECTATAKDGATHFASNRDYQGCLREVTNAVKAKGCVDGAKTVEFTFHRGGMDPAKQMAACN